jgi:hypothetical protein
MSNDNAVASPTSIPGTITSLLENPESRDEIIKQLLENLQYYKKVVAYMQSMPLPIISQASFNNQPVKWSNCKAPYPVYRDAFSNYSRGIKKGLPRSNKNSVRLATARAKKKVKTALLSVGNLEQQRYTLLYVLSDSAIRDIASSIGVNARDITLCQELVRSAKKLVQHATATSNRNCRISSDKHAVIQTAALLLTSTPPKDVTE